MKVNKTFASSKVITETGVEMCLSAPMPTGITSVLNSIHFITNTHAQKCKH